MIGRIKKIILPVLSEKDIEIDENTIIFKDLDINSYDVIELVCAIEEEFDISIPDKKIKSIVTVGDIINLIEQQK